MADKKAKSPLPDFNEITSIVGKLFGDLKKSIGEIVDDYKTAREPEKKAKPAAKKAAGKKTQEKSEGKKSD